MQSRVYVLCVLEVATVFTFKLALFLCSPFFCKSSATVKTICSLILYKSTFGTLMAIILLVQTFEVSLVLFQRHYSDRILGFSRTYENPDHTHMAVELLSEDSWCSCDSDMSEEEDSGSGFRIRKKRKQPTRLITVREMNTVRRSLSETNNMNHTLKIELLIRSQHGNY